MVQVSAEEFDRKVLHPSFSQSKHWCMPDFFKLLWFMHWFVCVCPHTRPLIVSGMTWHVLCNFYAIVFFVTFTALAEEGD